MIERGFVNSMLHAKIPINHHYNYIQKGETKVLTTTQSFSSNSSNYYCVFRLIRTGTNGNLGLGFTITP